MRTIFAISLALVFVAPGFAAPQKPPVTVQAGATTVATLSTPTQGASAELAALMAPRDLMIASEMKVLDTQFLGAMRKNEAFAETERQWPRVVPELMKELRPRFERYMARTVDRYLIEVANTIERRLTAVEVADLAHFYRSGIGKKTIRSLLENSDATEIIESGIKGRELDEAMINRQIKGSASVTAKQFTFEERAALIAFMKQPAFSSINRIKAEITAAKLRVFNGEDAELEKDIALSFERAMERAGPKSSSNR